MRACVCWDVKQRSSHLTFGELKVNTMKGFGTLTREMWQTYPGFPHFLVQGDYISLHLHSDPVLVVPVAPPPPPRTALTCVAQAALVSESADAVELLAVLLAHLAPYRIAGVGVARHHCE